MSKQNLVEQIRSQIVAMNGGTFYVIEPLAVFPANGLFEVEVVTWQDPPKKIKTLVNLSNVLAIHEANQDVLDQRNEQMIAMKEQQEQMRRAAIVPGR